MAAGGQGDLIPAEGFDGRSLAASLALQWHGMMLLFLSLASKIPVFLPAIAGAENGLHQNSLWG
jgi:hypothetical protein